MNRNTWPSAIPRYLNAKSMIKNSLIKKNMMVSLILITSWVQLINFYFWGTKNLRHHCFGSWGPISSKTRPVVYETLVILQAPLRHPAIE